MASPIGTLSGAQGSGYATSLERLANANRKLSEQTVQSTEQSRWHIDEALNTMMATQAQIQEQKVHVGQVLMNQGPIGNIIDTTA